MSFKSIVDYYYNFRKFKEENEPSLDVVKIAKIERELFRLENLLETKTPFN
ncbi:hypothetical protein UFOVP105_4 [uncultured Caudovirales phage]|uniref:Uncharacterized protein n=1 Tax=uncultured Caudovirales phage TaxID=2100421 RepID=A0A6J5L3N0_9CAUD|nr:hypothetical protein UFOVP105_4 [uncultured Caudovirales phage]